MDRETRVRTITQLCDEYDCSDKIRKVHFDQFVDRGWHPHPPDSFDQWWRKHDDLKYGGIDVKRAWNCKRYRDEWMEAKSVGLADYGNRTYTEAPNRMEETSVGGS